jgi:hypothetical protein
MLLLPEPPLPPITSIGLDGVLNSSFDHRPSLCKIDWPWDPARNKSMTPSIALRSSTEGWKGGTFDSIIFFLSKMTSNISIYLVQAF